MTESSPRPAVGLEQQTLEQIAEQASSCSLCRLCHGRRHVVFGAGNPNAELMFVGEAPGYHEDTLAAPFVGAAGEVFDALLSSIDVAREDVYVTSVVKCRPQRNRTPFPDEIEACEGYLFRQVGLVAPSVVCALGNVAIRVLTGKPLALSKVHGIPRKATFHGNETIVYPLFHPAAAMYTDSLLAVLQREFREIPRLMRGLEPQSAIAVPASTPTVAASEEQSQLSLEF